MPNSIISTFEHKSFAFDNEDYFVFKARNSKLVKNYNDFKQEIETGYFVGIDWIVENEKAFYVQPKLNRETPETDYIKMLFCCFKNPDIVQFSTDLATINFDEPFIEIERHHDLLTPLLVFQFLQVLSILVRKGLKKSYYKIDTNLNGKIKGKITIPETLKFNVFSSTLLE